MSIATPSFAGADLDEMIATRRDLHAHPEVGFEEVRSGSSRAPAWAAPACWRA